MADGKNPHVVIYIIHLEDELIAKMETEVQLENQRTTECQHLCNQGAINGSQKAQNRGNTRQNLYDGRGYHGIRMRQGRAEMRAPFIKTSYRIQGKQSRKEQGTQNRNTLQTLQKCYTEGKDYRKTHFSTKKSCEKLMGDFHVNTMMGHPGTQKRHS